MNDWKSRLVNLGGQWISHPRVSQLMQDERVMKSVMKAIEIRGIVQEKYEKSVDEIAQKMNLATRKEMKDLQRRLKKMERELAKAQKEQEGEPIHFSSSKKT